MDIHKEGGPIRPEDYVEPDCPISGKPLGTKQKKKRIPQQRVSQRLDELMAEKDYRGAERMLDYWLNEARTLGDDQGIFMVHNEQMGFYRKRGLKDKAYKAVEDGKAMLGELGYTDSVSGATFYTNAATVYTAFGEPEKGIGQFEKARDIYEANMRGNEFKLAGLYNNMATALVDMGRFDESDVLFMQAAELLSECPSSELESAVTYLNMLDRQIAQRGREGMTREEIDFYLDTARKFLDGSDVPRDGYYSFMADKCLGIYRALGWSDYADELAERIEEIDERA